MIAQPHPDPFREWKYRWYQGVGWVFLLLVLPLTTVVGLGGVVGGLLLFGVPWLHWGVAAGVVVVGLLACAATFFLGRRLVCDLRSPGLKVKIAPEGVYAPRHVMAREAELVPWEAIQAYWLEALYPEEQDDAKCLLFLVLQTPKGQWRIRNLKLPREEESLLEIADALRAVMVRQGRPNQPVQILQWGHKYEMVPPDVADKPYAS